MPAVKQVEDPMGQVFALASDCDSTRLSLTAAEGYLLSRIDGSTPWRLLREMGGIPAEQADSCLERWVDAGLLEAVPSTTRSLRSVAPEARAAAVVGHSVVDAAEAPPEPLPTLKIDETLLDPQLDLELGIQRRILEFEASLGLPYHQLLSVPRGSEPRLVKRAYFKLSKEFHPDRYFRREIGDYVHRLERIFKKVLEAHEMLSDPELCQVENLREAAEQVEADSLQKSSGSIDDSIPAKPRELTKLERLRQRMPFKINHAVLAVRREKAREIFRAAEFSLRAGRLAEAEASIRIAISFDPARAEFKEALGSLRIQAAGDRATKLLSSQSDRMTNGELREALKLLEDVLIYRPHDSELNDRAARVCLQLEMFSEAREYAEALIERTPDVAAHHTLLGRIHRKRNDLRAAVAEFEAALKLDTNDLDARRALASVRIGAHDVARGGKSWAE